MTNGGTPTAVAWLDRHQAPLAVAAALVGVLAGIGVPELRGLAPLIEPVLALLLFATFLQVPARRFGAALRDGRFLAVLLGVNFLVVPVLVFVLTRGVADDRALLVGALLVLLTPCVDYVIVFTGLAGGSAERLLAASPVLLAAQVPALLLLVPVMAGPDVLDSVDPAPFLRALGVLIALPLAAAWLLQPVARRRPLARRVEQTATAAMTPLLMLTLWVVAASQTPALGSRWGWLVPVLALFAVFGAVMSVLGAVVARWAGFGAPTGRALLFSGVTRNSLVVLPLALALPVELGPVPAVVVSQTLVELVLMVVLVRWAPVLVPDREVRPPAAA